MAVRSREEIMEMVRARVGEGTADEDIAFIEDINDTFADYETRYGESEDWKTKYEENDKEWRQKYKERFFQNEVSEGTDTAIIDNVADSPVTEDEKTSYEDLFVTE